MSQSPRTDRAVETAKDATQSAQSAAREASDHPVLDRAARAGYVMNGLLHLVIGWIVLRIATGVGEGEASNTGALAEIAAAPGGRILLWAGALAFLALALVYLATAFAGFCELSDRAKAAAKTVVYLALGVTTARFAAGGRSSDSEQGESTTAQLMQTTWGRGLVIAVGVGILAVGIYHVYKGVKKKFVEDLESTGRGHVGTAIIATGMVGYIARGVAFSVLGALVVTAAVTVDPSQAAGMDSAFRTLGEQPFGSVLLGLTGLGFAVYGVYSFARAWYARL